MAEPSDTSPKPKIGTAVAGHHPFGMPADRTKLVDHRKMRVPRLNDHVQRGIEALYDDPEFAPLLHAPTNAMSVTGTTKGDDLIAAYELKKRLFDLDESFNGAKDAKLHKVAKTIRSVKRHRLQDIHRPNIALPSANLGE